MASFMTRNVVAHEDRVRALQAQRHDLALELAQLGAEAGLPCPSVGLLQPRLMVALGEIELGEPAGAARLVQPEEGINVRQRLHERLRDDGEAPVTVVVAVGLGCATTRPVSARTPPTPRDRPSCVECSLEPAGRSAGGAGLIRSMDRSRSTVRVASLENELDWREAG